MSITHHDHQPGKSFPLGATLSRDGANFSVFAKHGAAAQLLLFDHVNDAEPSRVINLDPESNRTYHYWHAFVPGGHRGPALRLPNCRALRSGERAAFRA